MFEKLLSLLPYSPGLTHQMAFYSRRMREEAAIRRTGLIFLTLAFMIQFLTVLNPPQPTVANSSNDLINGGFSSASEARTNCVRDTQGFQRIMHYYGIGCDAIGNASTTTINRGGQDYYSMGRNPSACADTPVNISGAGSLYFRKLTCWNQQTWKVLRVQNNQGKTFYIIYDCGNLVSAGLPSPSQYVGVTGPATAVNWPVPPPAPAPAPTPAPAPAPKPVVTTSPPVAPRCQYNSSLPVGSPLCFKPCEYNSLIPATDARCKPCDKSVSSTDRLACIEVRKTAANITQGLANADGTTASGGDRITYTLYAQNKGKADVTDFVFLENMNDVMDYADIINLYGGSLGADKVVSWPQQTVKAGATASRQITVQVKNPIPQTPTSTSDGFHFDLVMTNVYGNAVNIKLPGSPIKAIEVATTTTLPNTGPGTSLAIAAGVVIVSTYFYSRAQLLARESRIAIKEATS